MKGYLICIGLCFVFALGIESSGSGAEFSSGGSNDPGLVYATGVYATGVYATGVYATGIMSGNALLLAQQNRATASSSSGSSSGTSYSGRGMGRFIKLAAVGLIALVGWFLKWTLVD